MIVLFYYNWKITWPWQSVVLQSAVCDVLRGTLVRPSTSVTFTVHFLSFCKCTKYILFINCVRCCVRPSWWQCIGLPMCKNPFCCGHFWWWICSVRIYMDIYISTVFRKLYTRVPPSVCYIRCWLRTWSYIALSHPHLSQYLGFCSSLSPICRWSIAVLSLVCPWYVAYLSRICRWSVAGLSLCPLNSKDNVNHRETAVRVTLFGVRWRI